MLESLETIDQIEARNAIMEHEQAELILEYANDMCIDIEYAM